MTKFIRIQPVIMSGGAGTRLWPMSREAAPKQFLALASDRSLFQEALQRVAGFLPAVVIGAGRHADLMVMQAKEIGAPLAAIIAEPCPRNTAAVAAIAALWAEQRGDGALVLLMPADQHVADAAGFRAAAMRSAASASSGKIVTLGIRPSEAQTGYGYVERGAELAPGVYGVAAFREKPDAATAARYVAGGKHFWNAGVFVYAPQTMIAALSRHAPDIFARARAALERATISSAVLHLDADEFSACRSDSLDYAVMEKTDAAAVAGPVDVGWSDVGSWSAIESTAGERAFLLDSPGAIVKTDGAFVAVAGLPDIVVVATKDAILVVPKLRAQDVKKIVEELKRRGRGDLL